MTIGEVSERTGLPVSTLRYYERVGLLHPRRNAQNVREYTQDDLDWIHFILHMLSTGMPVGEVREYVEVRRGPEPDVARLSDLLVRHRERVLEELEVARRSLRMLDSKIEFYARVDADDPADLYEAYRRRQHEHGDAGHRPE